VDVVGNHMGPVGFNYEGIVPFNTSSFYHDCNGCPSNCQIQDFQNQPQVEHCRLAGLPDLDQSNPTVSNALYSWIANLTKTYNIDGYRIDTVPEVSASFWPGFQKSAGVYCVGEVFDGRVDYVANYQNAMDGVLSYPLYFTLNNVFQRQQSMNQLESVLKSYNSLFKNVNYLGTFIDNHDNARFLSGQKDGVLYQNALTYVLLAQGIPIIYYGSEQGFNGGSDPHNREPLWTTGFNSSSDYFQLISKLVAYRNQSQIWNFPQIQRYADDRFYAFSRSTTFVALTNGGSGQSQIIRNITYHPYSNGQKLCNLMYTSDCVVVQNGQFPVYLNKGEFKVFHP